jgi:hypothetical protein
VILFIVWMFKSHLDPILRHFADEFAPWTLKFGSAEMSMAASLIVTSACSDPELSSDKHQVISENWGALTDPLADVIALRLWRGKARVEQMAREILEPTRLSGEQFVPAFMYSWTRNVRKILDALQALRYVEGMVMSMS